MSQCPTVTIRVELPIFDTNILPVCPFIYTCTYLRKGKGNVHPKTYHEDTEEEKRYNPILSLTSVPKPRPGRFNPRNDPVPNYVSLYPSQHFLTVFNQSAIFGQLRKSLSLPAINHPFSFEEQVRREISKLIQYTQVLTYIYKAVSSMGATIGGDVTRKQTYPSSSPSPFYTKAIT